MGYIPPHQIEGHTPSSPSSSGTGGVFRIPKEATTIAKRLIFTTANANKDRPGTVRYVRRLRKITRRMAKRRSRKGARVAGVLGLQEIGRGPKSTKLRGVRVNLRNKERWSLGSVGVHRAAAVGWVKLDGEDICVIDVHGLHVRSTSRSAQSAYFMALHRRIQALEALGHSWVVMGDFNLNHKAVARILGGTSVGEKIDGIVVSSDLKVRKLRTVRFGMRKRWTDHPAVIAIVRRKKTSRV